MCLIGADAETQQVKRDVRERGRDIEGCIKQWFSFVKPNFHRHVEPQRVGAGEFHVGGRVCPNLIFK